MERQFPTEEFFSKLLSETEIQFKKSPIYHKQIKLGKEWNYSVCGTPIVKGSGIFFGINWGGEDGYKPQTQIPDGKGIIKYPFIRKCKPLLEKYIGLDFTSINFNYTNFCFFRSPKEKDLMLEDYELSLPLFEKYIRYIKPPWILSIGGTNFKILDRLGLLKNIQRHFDNQKKFKGHSAHLWDYNIFSVPHPNAQLTSESRNTIWLKVAKEIRNIIDV